MKKIIYGITIFIVIQASGQSWTPVGGGTNAWVRTLCIFDNELYAGGDFISAGGVSVNGCAKWDGNAWHNTSAGLNFTIQCLQVYNNELYAGGGIGFAKWSGTSWVPVGTG